MAKTAGSETSLGTSSEPRASSILSIRGERVILDSDLAEVYGVATKRLNEQVKRNAAKFGGKYVFRLTTEEHEVLRSQSATSKTGRGGRRYPPWAFTGYGVVMAEPSSTARTRSKPASERIPTNDT